MKRFKVGDKSKAICRNCKKVVYTTFKYAPLIDNKITIPRILQAHCNICNESCSIPHQEIDKIRSFLEKKGKS
jgi:hypothetical protein